MTEAAYWLMICGRHCLAEYPSLLHDPWCVALLSEVAGPGAEGIDPKDPNRGYKPTAAGYDGWVWTFRDCSRLLVNSHSTLILGDRL